MLDASLEFSPAVLEAAAACLAAAYHAAPPEPARPVTEQSRRAAAGWAKLKVEKADQLRIVGHARN